MAKETLAGVQILLVDDEALLRRRLAAELVSLGADVIQVGSRAEAEKALAGLTFDVALLDVNLPDGRGTDLLRERRVPASTLVVVMTAEGGVAGAVEAMKLGAADYLAKPFEPGEMPMRIERARRAQRRRRAEEFRDSDLSGRTEAPDLFWGESLQPVQAQLEQILAADRRRTGTLPPVLIEGETGTGKTSFARWLHRHGPRAQAPLIEVNCSALPETLAESELFGHERGAFTDASSTRIGLMEAADGGTLFLDELPSLPLTLQAKLLTALEDGVIRRVGASRTKSVDVRLIAASSADLRERVTQGRFREDLFHRLDLFRLRLPPLRERSADLVELATRLAQRIGRQYGLTVGDIPAEGRRRLLAHRWPGNVRELAHEIERALVFGGGDGLKFQALAERGETDVGAAGDGWLNPQFSFPAEGFSLEAAIDELIARALRQSAGNVSGAARLLGVSRDYVRYRLKSGGEDRERGNAPSGDDAVGK